MAAAVRPAASGAAFSDRAGQDHAGGGDGGGGLAVGYIARWRPSSVSPQAAAFARDVITAADAGGRERAKNLLWAAARLAEYAVPLGLDAVPEVLLHPSVIERFARCAPGLSGVARRTLRTNLRFLARRVVPQLAPAACPCCRGGCGPPGWSASGPAPG